MSRKLINVNCSYGQFPDSPGTLDAKLITEPLVLADKIVVAAKNCPRDASERWRIPYSQEDLETFGKYKFKVELLPPLSQWIYMPATDLPLYAAMILGGGGKEFGVKLTIPFGTREKSATFIPSVLKEFDSIEDYLDSLSEKLGGRKGDWRKKNARVGIYHTAAFYWNSGKQKLEIEQ